MGRRRRSDINGHDSKIEAKRNAKRIAQARRYHPDPNPLRRVGDATPSRYNGKDYPTVSEAEWAKILREVYKVVFQDHVNLECHNNTRMTILEMDFIHPFIILPDGSPCNATEVKGVIDLEALVRNNAIRFTHTEIVPRFVTYEDIRYIQRWGVWGEKKPEFEHSKNWTPEKEKEFLALSTKLFNGYGVSYKSGVKFPSFDAGSEGRSIKLCTFCVDLLFIYPQKIRGISHEVDGVIVRLEPTPMDYLLVRSLKRYHGLDIAIVTVTYYKFWEKFGMFAENRQHRLRFGRRRKPRREGSEYLSAHSDGVKNPTK